MTLDVLDCQNVDVVVFSSLYLPADCLPFLYIKNVYPVPSLEFGCGRLVG